MHVPSGSHEGDSCIRIGFGRLYVVGDRPGEPGVIVHVKYISGISVVVIESIYSGSGIRLVVIVSIDDLSLTSFGPVGQHGHHWDTCTARRYSRCCDAYVSSS